MDHSVPLHQAFLLKGLGNQGDLKMASARRIAHVAHVPARIVLDLEKSGVKAIRERHFQLTAQVFVGAMFHGVGTGLGGQQGDAFHTLKPIEGFGVVFDEAESGHAFDAF